MSTSLASQEAYTRGLSPGLHCIRPVSSPPLLLSVGSGEGQAYLGLNPSTAISLFIALKLLAFLEYQFISLWNVDNYSSLRADVRIQDDR